MDMISWLKHVDDTSFLSQNNPNDMRVIMDALKLYGLAARLCGQVELLAPMKWLDILSIHWDGMQ